VRDLGQRPWWILVVAVTVAVLDCAVAGVWRRCARLESLRGETRGIGGCLRATPTVAPRWRAGGVLPPNLECEWPEGSVGAACPSFE
jgi:hypothetical protein